MRRPRGPGGRFLTADEIAAQKLSASNHSPTDNDHDMEDEESVSPTLPSDHAHDLFTASDPDPMAVIYHLQTHQLPLPQSHPRTGSAEVSPSHNVYPHNPTSHPTSITTPYTALQMHHVPHPHAHARHHHSSTNYSQSPVI